MFADYRSWRLAVAAVLILYFGSADDLPAAPLEIYEGTVTAVSKYAVTAVDPRDQKQRNFAVNQSTKITRDGNLAYLRDLQPGDAVKVSVRPLGDKLLALTITARSPRP